MINKIINKLIIDRVLQCIAFSVGLGAFLCLGSSLQLYSFSLLTSSEVSIYSSTFGDRLVQFPSLWDWVINLELAIFSLVSCIFYLIIRKHRYPRDIFLFGLVYFSLAHTIVDLFYAYRAGSFADMSQNVVANLIGAPIICGYIVLVLKAAEYAAEFAKQRIVFKRLFVLLLPLLLGLFVSAAAYYISATFFNPTPSKVEFFVERPFTASYSAKSERGSKKNTSDSEKDKKFGVFSNLASIRGQVYLRNFDSEINVNWVPSESNEPTARAAVKFFDGCTDGVSQKLAKEATGISVNSVESLKLKLDSGFSTVILGKKSEEKVIVVSGGEILTTWVQEEGKGELEVSQAVRKSHVKYSAPSGTMNFQVSGYLVKKENSEIAPTARSASVELNGRKYKMNFSMDERRLNNEVGCRALDIRSLDQKGMINISGLSGVISIVIDIVPSGKGYYGELNNVFEIDEINGYVSAYKLSVDEFVKTTSGGRVEKMQVRGGIKGLKINGVATEASEFDTYTVMDGELKGEIEKNGRLRFSGKAHSLYREEERVNLTRWERMDSSIKLILLSGMAAIFSSAFWLTGSLLQRNKIFRKRVLQ